MIGALMNLETIIISFVASSIGLSYVVYGKRRAKLWFALSGVGLMSYSYFIDSIGLSLIVGGVLIMSPFVLDR